MRHRATLALLLIILGLGPGGSGIEAKPVFLRGGNPAAAGGGAQACDGGSSVCVKFQNGQSFVTWTDLATGSAGNDWRYWVYRSAAPINSGNYSAATPVAEYVFNNSAQLFGGDPDTTLGAPFNQTNRQDAAQPMSVLTDLGAALPAYSGLQAYTALGSGSAYYAVAGKSCPGGVCAGGADTYIGSAGPIAESVAAPQPIKYAASGARADNSYGQITSPAGKPVIFNAHASSSSGGAATNNRFGDYWEWFLTAAEGWQDGRATALDVIQDNAQTYPGTASALVAGNRDTVWNPLGSGAIETWHQGLGMTPNPLVGAANRWYPSTASGIARMLNWVGAHYGADLNQVHWVGISMGAWGGANTGMRMTSPRPASIWLSHPVWRMDLRSSGGWPGGGWSGTMPFRATLGTAPATLGSTASSVLTSTGAVWGGTGGYADTPGFIAASPGTDLPAAFWQISKDDPYPASFLEQITVRNAFQSARRGHAFVWFMGAHDTSFPARGAIDCDGPGRDTAVCYSKASFKLNAPYLATSNSSIDDNPGTAARNTNGIYDGDPAGCVNCGFSWNITSDTSGAFNFTVDNAWMDRAPTAAPQTTLTGTLASSGTGSVTVTDGSVFQSVAANPYFLIGGTEIVQVSGVAGNTLTYSFRGRLGTTALAHASGETIRQYISQPTGPNAGPFATMTADITPRRMQGFIKTPGTAVTCTETPFGGSAIVHNLTIDSAGLLIITGITINATGATSVTCS